MVFFDNAIGVVHGTTPISLAQPHLWSGQTEAPLVANDDDDDPLSQKVH
jgi:hypothetical protein